LNRILRERPALYELDVEPRGFHWIDVNSALENVVAFARTSGSGDCVVCVCNFSAAPRPGYRFGLPAPGTYRLILNTDSSYYTGSNALHLDCVVADEQPWHGLPFSASVDLPPLTALLFEAPAPGAPGGLSAEACAAPAEENPAPATAAEGRKRAAPKKGAAKKAAKKAPAKSSKRAPRKKAE
jgi:1,4-alpha-glucan branching enzyme